jgi:osmotically-inducible protein OsmY
MRLPVVDPAGRLLGIVSRADVLAVFSRPDEEIRGEIVHLVLPAAVLSKSADFEVTVRDGIVTISGPPRTERAARALLDAARHVQGVVAVRDRFS